MSVVVSLPEGFAARFGGDGERDRHVLEVLALAEYRGGRMSAEELQQVLGFATLEEVARFLEGRGAEEVGVTADLGRGVPDLRNESEEERKAAGAELVERFRAFRVGVTLGGLKVKDLIEEGRR